VYAAFGHVNSSCELDFEYQNEVYKLEQLTESNEQVLISLGWGKRDIPAIEECPEKFARSVRRFIDKNKLKGFDIDCEDPIFTSEVSFKEVSAALRKALPQPFMLTITPTSLANLHVPTLNAMYDRVNVQSYWSDVSAFIGAGVSSSKLAAGINIESSEPIERAVNQVRDSALGGVYMWNCAGNVTLTVEALRVALDALDSKTFVKFMF